MRLSLAAFLLLATFEAVHAGSFMGYKSPADVEAALKAALELAKDEEAAFVKRSAVSTTPRYFNLAEEGYDTPVKNQGDCNAGVAFAAIAAVEGSILKQYDIKYKESGKLDLSEASLFHCAMASIQQTDCFRGSEPWQALAALEHMGVQAEAAFPYNEEYRFCARQSVVHQEFRLSFQVIRTPTQARQWMLTRGPVMVSMFRGEDSMINAANNYTYDSPFGGRSWQLHAVSCTGFDWNYKSPNTNLTGAWICKNSYGTTFGNKGYFRVAVGQLAMFGGNVGDAVGIVVSKDIPQCVRGNTVADPHDGSFIDSCDAVRLGHEAAVAQFDGAKARRYYQLALSVVGMGIEPLINCTPSFPFRGSTYPVELATYITRGTLNFFSNRAILAPLVSAGCQLRPAAQFRIAFRNFDRTWLCADRVVPTGSFNRNLYPLGFGTNLTIDEWNQYCQSSLSLFTLQWDGSLSFQGRAVGVTTFEREQYLVVGTGATFAFNGQHLSLASDRTKCVVFVNETLRLGSCRPKMTVEVTSSSYMPRLAFPVAPPLVGPPWRPAFRLLFSTSVCAKVDISGQRIAASYPTGSTPTCLASNSRFNLLPDGKLMLDNKYVGIVLSMSGYNSLSLSTNPTSTRFFIEGSQLRVVGSRACMITNQGLVKTTFNCDNEEFQTIVRRDVSMRLVLSQPAGQPKRCAVVSKGELIMDQGCPQDTSVFTAIAETFLGTKDSKLLVWASPDMQSLNAVDPSQYSRNGFFFVSGDKLVFKAELFSQNYCLGYDAFFGDFRALSCEAELGLSLEFV